MILEYAYKNDFVDTGLFSEKTLEKKVKLGLLMLSPIRKGSYLITEKGLKKYKDSLR